VNSFLGNTGRQHANLKVKP